MKELLENILKDKKDSLIKLKLDIADDCDSEIFVDNSENLKFKNPKKTNQKFDADVNIKFLEILKTKHQQHFCAVFNSITQHWLKFYCLDEMTDTQSFLSCVTDHKQFFVRFSLINSNSLTTISTFLNLLLEEERITRGSLRVLLCSSLDAPIKHSQQVNFLVCHSQSGEDIELKSSQLLRRQRLEVNTLENY